MRLVLSIVGTSPSGEDARSAEWTGSEIFLQESTLFVEADGLKSLLRHGDRLRFLHSATAGGNQSASALTSYFVGHGYPAAAIEVPGLTYLQSPPVEPEEEGLRSLVSILCGELRAAYRQKQQALLYSLESCASISAQVALVGQVFHTPVYSRFPYGSLPAVPMTQNLIPHYEGFFRWLQEDRRPSPLVQHRLTSCPEAAALLGSDHQGFTTLSPLGELFFEAYLAQCEWKSHAKTTDCDYIK